LIREALQKAEEREKMTALFPTYTSLWQRAKRLLAMDIYPLWHCFIEACERDSERYQRELEEKGLGDLDCFGFGKFY
jgi:hypothetical protein